MFRMKARAVRRQEHAPATARHPAGAQPRPKKEEEKRDQAMEKEIGSGKWHLEKSLTKLSFVKGSAANPLEGGD